MKKANIPTKPLEALRKKFEKHKYVIIVLLVGALILLWPGGSSSGAAPAQPGPSDSSVQFSLEEEERRLAEALAQIEGAGEVIVLLSLRSSVLQEVAVDEDDRGRRAVVTVPIGGGAQQEITLRYHFPEFQGALIISQGGDNPTVRLQITQAVAALTGLRTDRITVSPMA